MKIAFLNPQGNFDPGDSYWSAHPDFGGQLVYVKEVAMAIAALGHPVDILTRRVIDPDWPEFSGELDAYPGAENLRIIRLPAGPERFLPKEQLWPHLGTGWVPNILDFYKDEDLPEIFTAHYGDGGLAGALLKAKTGIPFTFTGHSLGAQKMDKLGVSQGNLAEMEARYQFSRRNQAERLSMDHAARIITSTRQERLEQYGHRAYRRAIDPADESRFAVTPPGVNRQVFSPQPGQHDTAVAGRIRQALENQLPEARRQLPVVLAASRLDEKKNHIGVVRAFAQNPKLQHSANLAIVVRGLENPLEDYSSLSDSEKAVMDQIAAEIDAHALEDAVFAFPLNSQDELAAAYRYLAGRQSLFILTALYEPFGLAPLEAMSCGLPAVVTQNGGPQESMRAGEQEFGVLVDPADPGDIARGILRLTTTADEWERFHLAGIERVVSTYTWERTAEGYLKVFDQILAAAGQRRETLPIPPYFTDPATENDDLLFGLEELYF